MIVDTAASLCLISESVLTETMKMYVEQYTCVTIQGVSNTKAQHLGQIRLYVHLYDLVVQFYFSVLRAFLPKLLICTKFCDLHIASIKPNLRQIIQNPSLQLPILAFNYEIVSVLNLHPGTSTKMNIPTRPNRFPLER